MVSVLIVDDDPAFLALAARIVEDLGAAVVAKAGSATSAIIAAEETHPDAALVDVGLPDRDGIDLAYELAGLPWAPRVILTSTDSDACSAITTGGGAGMLPFVSKEDLANGVLRELLMGE